MLMLPVTSLTVKIVQGYPLLNWHYSDGTGHALAMHHYSSWEWVAANFQPNEWAMIPLALQNPGMKIQIN